jgi:winged helix DNA-binding protein
VEVARRLVGVQAQVASAAELAVAVRRRSPRRGEIDHAIADRALVKTWAMRGTLHLLPADVAPIVLATLSRLRPWTAPAWERYHGVTAADVQRVLDALPDVVSDQPITREELGAAVAGRVRSKAVAGKLASGWSELLKPAAFAGMLLQGPPREGRATFVRSDAWVPSWSSPDPEEAGADLLRMYLAAHGPAAVQHVADWWARQRASVVRPWFERLGDELVTVEVEGAALFALKADLAALRRTEPNEAVRLLPNFDQYFLGAGSGSAAFVPAARKARVSRTAGWISPLVLSGGRVVGVWELDREAGRVDVEPFEPLPRSALNDEAAHLGRFLGRELAVRVGRGGGTGS